MLCEKCKEKKATVHMTHNVNGVEKQMYLCSDCAFEKPFAISFDKLFSCILESFFGEKQPVAAEKAAPPSALCPVCGFSVLDFKKIGKLGCAECYNTFRTELNYIIKNIQGSNVHEGKLPKRAGATYAQKREIEHLKADLKRAVEKEEYETAAKLRDEIKRRSLI